MDDCDYVIVGSGAGGGTLAARLAEAGMRVVVLEAGGDARDGAGLPEDYDVPAFHPLASENPALRWDFFVQHYEDAARQRRDRKLQPRGHLLSARRHTRRLHRAQCDDPDGAARFRLGRHRGTDRRCIVARDGHAALLPAAGAMPLPAGVAHLVATRPGPDGTWLGRLAADRVRDAVAGARRPAAGGNAHRVRVRGAARIVAPGANAAATGGVATGSERPARAADAMPMGSASHRSAPTGTSGWERANVCSTSRRAIRIG